MTLVVHNYTVKICTQELNTKPSAKDIPFIYKIESINFKSLTTDELEHIESEAWAIAKEIEDEKIRRINEQQ